jgi:hypothetical protein
MRNRTVLACVAFGMICLLIPAFLAARQTAGAKPTAKAGIGCNKDLVCSKDAMGRPGPSGHLDE